MARISVPKPSSAVSSITTNVINAASITPVSQAATNVSTLASIVSPPLGPDGLPLSLSRDGSSWISPQFDPRFSVDQINEITQNGANTDDVFDRGLDAIIRENLGGLFDPSLLAQPSNLNLNTEDSVPDTFDEISKLIGQQLWKYEVKLFNHQQEEYTVPTKGIKVLCIEDDLLTWPLRGYIIVDNRQEGFERGFDTKDYYFLRSDARDEIRVKMWPEVEKGSLPDKIWKIEFTGIVYDVEDLPHSDLTLKAKKLYFWDKKFQFLLEKNIQWSTATGKRFVSEYPPVPIAHTTDEKRAMYTGEAIASLLSEAGYEEFIDQEKWDWGKSRILFTAKADWNIWECIQYILKHHISSDEKQDICALKWNRGDKKWNLTPAWTAFDKAGDSPRDPGELQLEHMFFEENVTDDKESIVPNKAPLDLSDNPNYEKDIKADEYNKIRNYRFVQPSGLDNAKAFLSKPVYSHWHRKKQFDVDVKENEIQEVKNKYFMGNYVDSLYSKSKYAVMAMNTTKKDQYAVMPQFSPVSTLDPLNDRYMRSLDGRGSILFAGIFLNQNLSIRMTGSTHRMSGTFIGVDRVKTSSETIYDYQICGQYLVTNVKHIIQQQKYINEINMVKIHAYDKLPVNEDIK